MKYKCCECGYVFSEEEAGEIKTTYESYCGVSSEFHDSHPFTYLVCPYCGSDEIEEYYGGDDDEDEDEE